MNVPQLRFEGFDEEWKEFSFDQIASITMGQSPSGNSYNTLKQGEPLINGPTEFGDIYPTPVQWTTKPSKFSKPGDTLLCVRGSSIGRMNLSDSRYCIGRGVAAISGLDNKTTSAYMKYVLEKEVEKILKRSTGSTFPNISGHELKQSRISVPNLKEQEKIAKFLTALDYKREKQQEKIEKLEQFKKSMMQKIFSQELRFKAEDGGEFPEWEEKQLGQVLKIKHGRDQKKIETPDGQFPILATGGTIGRTDTFIYNKESVLIGRKGTIDRPVYMDTPFWTVDTLFYSEIKKDNYPKFIFYVFQNINWKLYNEASGVPSLSAKTIEAIKITAPSYSEQKMIADYLSNMDKKIDKEKEKLMVLEEQKKGFMQGIFV